MAAVLGTMGRRFDKGVINREQLCLALAAYLTDDAVSPQGISVQSWSGCPMSWVLVPRGVDCRASLSALAMDIQRNISVLSKGVAEHFGMAVKLSKKFLPHRFSRGMRDMHRAYVFARHFPCAELPKAVPGMAFYRRWMRAFQEVKCSPRWMPKMPSSQQYDDTLETENGIHAQGIQTIHGLAGTAVNNEFAVSDIQVAVVEVAPHCPVPSSSSHGNYNDILDLSTSDFLDMRNSAERRYNSDPYDNISSSTFLALRGDFDESRFMDEDLTLSDLEDARDAAEDFHALFPPLCDAVVPVPPPGASIQPCQKFKFGKCLWGAECWFRHDVDLHEQDLSGAFVDGDFVGQEREPHGLAGIPSFSFPALLGEGSWLDDGDDLQHETVTLALLSNGTYNNRLAMVTIYSIERGRYGVTPYGSSSSIWVRPHNVFYPAFCPVCESCCSGPTCYACGFGHDMHPIPSLSSEG